MLGVQDLDDDDETGARLSGWSSDGDEYRPTDVLLGTPPDADALLRSGGIVFGVPSRRRPRRLSSVVAEVLATHKLGALGLD